MNPFARPILCRHCKARRGRADRYWLCDTCYRIPELRKQYRVRRKPGEVGYGLGLCKGQAPRPTKTKVGSLGRIKVYRWRAKNHYELFHPLDKVIDES